MKDTYYNQYHSRFCESCQADMINKNKKLKPLVTLTVVCPGLGAGVKKITNRYYKTRNFCSAECWQKYVLRYAEQLRKVDQNAEMTE